MLCFLRLSCVQSVHSTLSRSAKQLIKGMIHSRTANCWLLARPLATRIALPCDGFCSSTALICLPSWKYLTTFWHSCVSTPCSCSLSGHDAGKRPMRCV